MAASGRSKPQACPEMRLSAQRCRVRGIGKRCASLAARRRSLRWDWVSPRRTSQMPIPFRLHGESYDAKLWNASLYVQHQCSCRTGRWVRGIANAAIAGFLPVDGALGSAALPNTGDEGRFVECGTDGFRRNRGDEDSAWRRHVSVRGNSCNEARAAAESAPNSDRHARPIRSVSNDAVCGFI